MTKEEGEVKAKENANMIGQRWKHISSGSSEVITDIRASNHWKKDDTWFVEVFFEPEIRNGVGSIRTFELEDFLKNYQRIN